MEFLKITVKAARVNAGFTLDDAAKEIGICKRTLIKYEQGKTTPSIERKMKISEVYKFPIDNINFCNQVNFK